MTRASTHCSWRCRFRGRARFNNTSDDLHRLHDDKRVVEVYDYVDANVRMLARMYDRRLKGYGDMGYKVLAATPQKRLGI